MGTEGKKDLKRDGPMYDVLIVGAGPVGCFTASALADAGFSVVVLEKDGMPKAPPVCTGVIGVEAFQKFDLPLDSVISRIKDIVLFSPSGKTIAYGPSATQAYVVDRSAFDDALKGRAQAAGAFFLEKCACSDIDVKEDHVEVTTSRRGEAVKAKTAVIASGYNPRLTEKAGLGRIAEYCEGVQTEVRMRDVARTEIYVGRNVAPFSFAWVAPLGQDLARIGLITRRRATFFLDKFLARPGIRERLLDKGSISRKLIPLGQLAKSFTDRTIVVGEAAGQVKSTTHGGIYYGLISARCAVETLKEAFVKHDFGAGQMGAYERRWRRILEKEIKLGFLLQRVISALSDNQIERLFVLASRDGIIRAVHEKAVFDWHSAILSYLTEHPFLKGYFRRYS